MFSESLIPARFRRKKTRINLYLCAIKILRMKNLLYLFLMLTVIASAQDLAVDSAVMANDYFGGGLGIPKSTIDSMMYNGKQYYIYPYVLEAEPSYEEPKRSLFRRNYDYAEAAVDYAYDGDYNYNSGKDIPPVLDSLPTGEYLLLQNPTITKKMRKKNQFPPQIVRAIFSVERGLVNGHAVFYNSYDTNKTKEGNFLNGNKDGEWKAYYSCNGKPYYDSKIYINGKVSGPFKECNCHDTILYVNVVGQYVDGHEEGEIKKYSYDSIYYLREHYEARGEGYANYYYYYGENGVKILEVNAPDSTFTMSYKSLPAFREDPIEDSKKKKRKKNEYYDEMIDSYNDDYYYNSYSRSLPSGVPFVYRYENGQVYGRFRAAMELDYDTLYRENGKAAIIRTKLPDTLSKKRYVRTTLEPSGKIYSREYVIKSKYSEEYRTYESWLKNDQDSLVLKYADYSELLNYKSKKYNGPSLVLTEKYNRKEGAVSKYYSTILKKEFKKVESKDFGYKIDFKITTHDTLATAYEHSFELDNVKAVVYSFKDTAHVYKPEQRRITAAVFFERFDRKRSRMMQDSLMLYVDGKPFTGRLNVGFGKGDKLVTTKKGEVNINMSPVLKKKGNRDMFMIKMSGSYVHIDFVDGTATYLDLKLREKRRLTTVQAQLKNSVPNGKVAFKQVRVKKMLFKTLQEEGSGYFVNGMPHGTMYSYRSGKHGKRYLASKESFNNGVRKDTTYHYTFNGKVSTMNVFDDKGESVYRAYYDEETGALQGVDDHRKSETVPAFSFELNAKGDTVEYSTELNGKKNGRSYYLGEQSYYGQPEEINNTHDQLWVNYKDDKISGSVIYKDDFGIKRVELKVDSSYNNPYFYRYNLGFMMYSWKDGACFDFAGDVIFYHPTRQPFFKGKMAYKIPAPIAKDTTMEEEEMPAVYDDEYAYARVDTAASASSYAPNSYKVGLWTYYDPQGIKLIEVNYSDTTDLILGKDTTRGIGSYKAFYENGQVRYTGRLLEEANMLDCESDLPERDFTVLYDSYFAKDGSPLVKKGTGTLKIYHNNEMVRYEGEVVNGQKNGWWKEYNKDGVLKSAGKYVNGVKDGRWLYGDLTGINYLDDRCFESEDMKLFLQQMVQYSIEIQEEVYENGELVKEETYTFRRAE